ncbi:hypothetical protein [Streptomyces sp. NPDC057115]|uniref:hypothetical protein n=1 Tax=Streptomyces sp. NPDC057115 TaxID=3346022 RepID=UPI0036442F2F
MARLQILELPEGTGDDRPPFILVVDQYVARRYVVGVGQSEQPIDEFDGIAEKIGARAVLAFEDTIDIPANDLDGYNGIPGGYYTAFAATVERALGIDTSSAAPDVAGWLLTACRELEKSETAREQLRQERDAQAAALDRVRNLHRPVEHRGQTICWECSDYDFPGQTTDSPPVAHDQCGTLRALNGEQEQQ